MRWRNKPITATERMKAQTPRRTRNPQSKATKTFHAKKVLRKERKRLSVKGKKYLLTQKYSDGEMQGFVGGIGHHESKRLYEKCASSPKFMCLAKWFNAVFNDNFPKFCEWNKA